MRLPTLLLGAGGIFLTAALTTYISTGGDARAALAAIIGGAVVLLGLVLDTRWIRSRIPSLKTFAMELSAQRDECHELRRALKKQTQAEGTLESWDDWRQRVEAWDAGFWMMLERRLPDLWRVYRREQSVIPESVGGNWAAWLLGLLDQRLTLLKQLMEREHTR